MISLLSIKDFYLPSLKTLEDLSHHTIPSHHGRLRLQSVVRSRCVDFLGEAQHIVKANHLFGSRPAQLRRQVLVYCSIISTSSTEFKDATYTEEVLHEIPPYRLLRLVAEHEHISGTLAGTEVCG